MQGKRIPIGGKLSVGLPFQKDSEGGSFNTAHYKLNQTIKRKYLNLFEEL
jgi:hypothetical protein